MSRKITASRRLRRARFHTESVEGCGSIDDGAIQLRTMSEEIKEDSSKESKTAKANIERQNSMNTSKILGTIDINSKVQA